MTIPRSPTKPRLLFRFLLAAPLGAAVGGCTYDWTYVVSLEDAGVPDATIADAGPTDAVAPLDATGGDALPPPLDAGLDAPADAPPSPCAQLYATLEKDRQTAKACSGPTSGQCQTWLVDECGCSSHVADADSGATSAFAAALGAFVDAGCTPSCADGGCNGALGACLPATGDHCYP